MPSTSLSEEHQQLLLALSKKSITHGASTGEALAVNPETYDEPLKRHRCCFVTLYRGGELRGCIGALEARQPLVAETSQQAFAAAFKDYRFTPITESEIDELSIEISVLTPQTPLQCNTEEELLARLRPGVDGLTIEVHHRRATFLPAVWQSLPDKRDFLMQLKRKAGLASDYWSHALKASCYQVMSFSTPTKP